MVRHSSSDPSGQTIAPGSRPWRNGCWMSMMTPSNALPIEPEFLTVDDVLELHAVQLTRYGGARGLRDRALLESAMAQPMASFGGTWLHPDLWSMAAAYLYHLVQNHPF